MDGACRMVSVRIIIGMRYEFRYWTSSMLFIRASFLTLALVFSFEILPVAEVDDLSYNGNSPFAQPPWSTSSSHQHFNQNSRLSIFQI